MFHIKLNDPHFLPHIGCDIELTLKSGECYVLIGENGVGKSSLARRICTELQGQSVGHVEQQALEHFYDRKLETFKSILLDSCLEKIDRTYFEELWNDFGLAAKESRFLSQLSGGENQALKIVIGLCGHHEYLILDEPSQFLDSQKKEILKSKLLKLLSAGKSLLVIEHDLQWLPSNRHVDKLEVQNGILKKVTA